MTRGSYGASMNKHTRITISPKTKGCFLHFSARARERLGSDVDCVGLWRHLIETIEGDSGDDDSVRFVTRLNKRARRLWLATLAGRTFFVVYDHATKCPVTVLSPQGQTRCWAEVGAAEINLEAFL